MTRTRKILLAATGVVSLLAVAGLGDNGAVYELAKDGAKATKRFEFRGRTVRFSGDGKTLYLSVGSGSNVADDIGAAPQGGVERWARDKPLGYAWGSEQGRAEVRAYDPDGGNERVVATGLRNSLGLAATLAALAGATDRARRRCVNASRAAPITFTFPLKSFFQNAGDRNRDV